MWALATQLQPMILKAKLYESLFEMSEVKGVELSFAVAKQWNGLNERNEIGRRIDRTTNVRSDDNKKASINTRL